MRPSLAQKKSFATANVCYAHPTSCHAGVCDVAEGFCVTAARLHETSRFPMGRMRMDDIEFHGEPPPISPRWSWRLGLAGEAATGALRSLVRQLAATPLATIDPEAFVDFTTIRPVVRLNAEGAHDPLAADRVLDLAATRWRCRAAAFSRRRAPAAMAHIRDPAPGRGRALWGAADRVAGRGPRGRAAYPAPPRTLRPRLARTVGGVRDTDTALALRRPDRHEHGRRGCGGAGLSALTLRGQAGGPAPRRARQGTARRASGLRRVAMLWKIHLFPFSSIHRSGKILKTNCF